MKTSETIDKIAEALSACQGMIKNAAQSGKSHLGEYSTLTDVWDAIREPASKNGLAVVQVPRFVEGRIAMVTLLMHKSGQWIETDELPIRPQKDDAHSVGSSVTYGRRYSLAPLFGVVDQDDDDGNAAMGHEPAKRDPIPVKKTVPDILFDCKNPKHLEWVEAQLKERSISADKHDAIAKAVHGYTRKTFEDFLVHKGYKPAQGWVE